MANKKEEVNHYYPLKFFELKDFKYKNPLGYAIFKKLNPHAKKLYYRDSNNFCWISYAELIFFKESSALGVKIANMLKKVLSDNLAKEIEFIDVVNPYQIPNVFFTSGKFVSFADTTVVFEDEKFVCGITPKNERITRVYLFKK